MRRTILPALVALLTAPGLLGGCASGSGDPLDRRNGDGGAGDASSDRPGPDAGCRNGSAECPVGERCNPATGRCEPISDACREVMCATGELCVDGACLADADGDGVPENEDCDDSDDAVLPGAPEQCNAGDDDCDGEVDESADCGCDRETYDGHTYLFCEDSKTWEGARDECTDRGYDLVVLDSSDEEDWVRDETGPHNYWLGLTDREDEGVYRWIDGTVKDESTIDWGTNEYGGRDQNCIIMRRLDGRSGNFHDRACSDTYYYICETG